MNLILHVEPEDIYKVVGRNIRRRREALKQTQAHVAVVAGISRASVANIEAGRQQVLVHHLYGIASALSCEPSEFLPTLEDFLHEDNVSELPLPGGLTKQQQQDVLRVLSSALTEQEPDNIKSDS